MLLMELDSCGVKGADAKLLLYRLWADFATGGSDRRPVATGTADLASDMAVRMIESFCGWEGNGGDLILACIAANFLAFDPAPDGGSGGHLICTGFFPINSAWCRSGKSMQKKGGWARAAQRQVITADREAGERMELWKRTGASFGDMSASDRGEALRFVLRVCRAMNVATPTDDELRAGPLRLASEIIARTSAARLNDIFVWIIGNRSAQGIPTRLDLILRDWEAIEKRALSEMG
jgi:hypothetical protein